LKFVTIVSTVYVPVYWIRVVSPIGIFATDSKAAVNYYLQLILHISCAVTMQSYFPSALATISLHGGKYDSDNGGFLGYVQAYT
jgi:hypothetical protein